MSESGSQSAATAQPAALWNLANLLTASRLILVPVFLFALLVEQGTHSGWRITAAVVFAVAALTDRIDGDLARRRGQVTDFGKVADPLADKALTGAALVGLSILGDLAWWITVVIAVREIGVTILRMAVLRLGAPPTSRGGRTKTFVQAVAIGLYVLPLAEQLESVRWVAIGIALVLTVATGVDYAVQATRLWARARRGAFAP